MTTVEIRQAFERRALNGARAYNLSYSGIRFRVAGGLNFETTLTAAAWFAVLESPHGHRNESRPDSH